MLIHGIDPMTAAALGGAAGGWAKSLVGAARRAYDRRRARADIALEEAYNETGLHRGQLLELALEDDQKLELLISAVESAMREADERRVRFYGRIAASGVLADDTATVDAAARVFATIAALDPLDLKTLLYLASADWAEVWLVDQPEDGRAENVFSKVLPELAPAMDSIVARLETLGLISARENKAGVTWGNMTMYRLTSFARLCVRDLVNDADAAPEPTSAPPPTGSTAEIRPYTGPDDSWPSP